MPHFFGAPALAVMVVLVVQSAVAAPSTPSAPGSKDPSAETAKRPPITVSARLIAKRTTYFLPDGGKRLRQEIDEVLRLIAAERAAEEGEPREKQIQRRLERDHNPVPAAPAVDLVLEMTNTSALPIDLVTGGDFFRLTFDLRGPGAATLPSRWVTTAELYTAEPLRLAPGESIRIPIQRLSYGMRGDTRAYWTRAGTYTLSVSVHTVAAPGGAEPANRFGIGPAFAPLEAVSTPVTITVEARDDKPRRTRAR